MEKILLGSFDPRCAQGLTGQAACGLSGCVQYNNIYIFTKVVCWIKKNCERHGAVNLARGWWARAMVVEATSSSTGARVVFPAGGPLQPALFKPPYSSLYQPYQLYHKNSMLILLTTVYFPFLFNIFLFIDSILRYKKNKRQNLGLNSYEYFHLIYYSFFHIFRHKIY